MSDALANLFAKNFIARQDVKAIQLRNGYAPHVLRNGSSEEYIPWRKRDLLSHLSGSSTFGHYLLNADSDVKLFAFDIDLQKNGKLPTHVSEDWTDVPFGDVPDLRAAWSNRAHPGRNFIKYQMKSLAHKLARVVTEELELPCAVSYSGNKGIHVYAFTGMIPAAEARLGARIVLDILGRFTPTKGDNFFVDSNSTSSADSLSNLSIEVFPKQDSLDGKTLGNLMRLPLGVNLKSSDPTFFVDMTSPIGLMVPVDPTFAMQGNPWKSIND